MGGRIDPTEMDEPNAAAEIAPPRFRVRTTAEWPVSLPVSETNMRAVTDEAREYAVAHSAPPYRFEKDPDQPGGMIVVVDVGSETHANPPKVTSAPPSVTR